MARSSSGFVAGLTAAAVAAVCFLAYQASATAPADLSAEPARPAASPTAPAPGGVKPPVKEVPTPPKQSGAGARVVYSLGERRVWLVDAKDKVTRTFAVMPSTVHPKPGSYTVTSRAGSVPGSDGVRIEHVVRFTSVDGVTIGFSAAVDGSMATPDPARRTGGIRMKPEDGDMMWTVATINSKVVVVP
ncbi:hypothetical protein [Streptomyces sp. SP18CS02]|uniref:hypothetical protein n=1 Tax=Streptomyces sp. SP18CS02 TaxID=3002531 RepID=UPI002E765886|nr:hypothetical protein [Streptomyces sp. SP18CS02]MEE1756059.1 hypothetical protein [Streptomyces sp. SP18CS02]